MNINTYSKYKSFECSNDGSTAQWTVVRAPINGVLAKINFAIRSSGYMMRKSHIPTAGRNGS